MKCVSCGQQIIGSFFGFCLFVFKSFQPLYVFSGEFSQFFFSVIADKKGLTPAVLLFVFWLFCGLPFSFLSSFQWRRFSLVVWFNFLLFVICIFIAFFFFFDLRLTWGLQILSYNTFILNWWQLNIDCINKQAKRKLMKTHFNFIPLLFNLLLFLYLIVLSMS